MKIGKTMAFGAIAVMLTIGMAAVLMSGSVSAFGNGSISGGNGDLDQVKGQVQDATCDQDRIKAQDGSCQDPACDQEAACDRDRARAQDKAMAQDGSCQDVTCNKDQTRDRDRSCW